MSSEERKKNPSAFLRSLFQILQRQEVNQTICWAPKQNGFVIKNLQKFQETILPQYFKHKKYSSFVRQLNMYGFHKQRSSNNQNCFLHDTFKKSDGLPVDIRRKPQKKKKAEMSMDKEQQQKDNWFLIGKQLQEHFPHIICYNKQIIKNQSEQKNYQFQTRKIEYSGSKSSQQAKQYSNQMSVQQSQQYISKISLKGIFDNYESKEIEKQNNQIQTRKNNKQCQNSPNKQQNSINSQNKQVKNTNNFQDKQNFTEKKEQQNILLRSSEMNTFNQQNTLTSQRNSIQNINSLTALCEILIKQNRILQSTHPKIRKVCLQTQKNEIQFKTQQLKLLKKQLAQEEYNQKTKEIIQIQNKCLTQTTQMIVQNTFKLRELIQEQNIISTTSIKFNLQK